MSKRGWGARGWPWDALIQSKTGADGSAQEETRITTRSRRDGSGCGEYLTGFARLSDTFGEGSMIQAVGEGFWVNSCFWLVNVRKRFLIGHRRQSGV